MRSCSWSSDVCSSDLVESLRQLAQERLGVGGARRLPQFLGGCGPVAVAQIVARRGGEDHRFLRHHRDARADGGGVGGGQRHAIEADLARLRVVEALGELEEGRLAGRSEEHTSELQSLMRISYAVFCLQKKKQHKKMYAAKT